MNKMASVTDGNPQTSSVGSCVLTFSNHRQEIVIAFLCQGLYFLLVIFIDIVF